MNGEGCRAKEITFLDVSAKIQDPAANGRYEGISDFLLRAVITTERDDQHSVLCHGGWAKDGCGYEMAKRDGGHKSVEFA